MAKNILQDIKPLTRTSVLRSDVPTIESPVTPPPVVRPPTKHLLWYIAVPAIIVLLFSISLLFNSARVIVTAKTKDVNLEDTLKAEKDSTNPDEISFTVMSLSGDEKTDVPGETTKEASIKAKGSVIIYNEYSSASQPLVVSTRLQTPDGKIFRIDKAVTVPGYTKSGTTITPGSVAVTVTADQAGDTYNIAAGDFKIPGFSGSPKFDKFYARSKGSMTGGATGTVHEISATTAAKAQSDLVEKSRTNLTQELNAQVPEGFILYPDLVFFDPGTGSAPVLQSTTATVPVTLHSTISAYLISRATLVRSLSKTFTTPDDQAVVTMPDLDKATVALSDKANVTPEDTKEISFSISGPVKAIWNVDQEALIQSLLGKSKKDFQTILATNPSVSSAELVVTPFWRNSIPSNTKDIHVTVK